MIEINGMAHVMLTVSQFDKARAFYGRLMPALGLECVFDGGNMCYFVGARTALGIHPCAPEHAGERFVQGRVGLHHVCFRARARADVDRVHTLLLEMNALIVSPAKEGPWVPGYYYVLFEDPDGIRVEVNFVPGQGVLAKEESFNPGDDYR
ncbi:MAG: VOC family protein [Alphaproteobacteria bacterium]|jgi:catechol 2,3-dioxygenase-like lactoylglutathione lyase family enzyme|nr:VOC family protein [Alphaproteobacteria bacterium]